MGVLAWGSEPGMQDELQELQVLEKLQKLVSIAITANPARRAIDFIRLLVGT